MPDLYLTSSSLSVFAFISLAFIISIFFIFKKGKTKISYYLTVICSATLLKVVMMFIQISFISDSNVVLYHVYYISLYIVCIANIVFSYEYNKKYIVGYIKPFVFYIFIAISVILLSILTINVPLEETKSFSVKLSSYIVRYNSINDNIIFIIIYVLLLIALSFHITRLIALAKSVNPNVRLSLKTILFYKDAKMMESKIFILSIFFITIYYVIYKLLESVFYNGPIFSNLSMVAYIAYAYILLYAFFRNKNERKSFSIRVVMVSLIIIYSIVFMTVILLKKTVLNIFYNDIKHTIDDVKYNLSNGVVYNENIDYILVKRPENTVLGLDSITELIYLKSRNHDIDQNYIINRNRKVGIYDVSLIKKLPILKDQGNINNIFLIDSFIFDDDKYEVGISYIEMRETLNTIYEPYFFMYVLISLGIFSIYPVFIRRRMNKSLKMLIDAQKAFLSDKGVVAKNYIYGKDEFTYLIESFYGMVKNIEYNLNKLEENNKKIKDYSENLEEIVDSKSIELENTYKKLKKEEKIVEFNMELALELQKNIYPELPNMKNLEYYEISKGSGQLIGEVFSTVKINEKYVRFFSASMEKNDIQSAMFVMILKSMYENIKFSHDKPSSIIKELNDILLYNKANINIFAKAIIVDLDLDKNELIYSSSDFGKEYIIHNGEVLGLEATQKDMLGVLENYNAIDRTIKIENDMKIIFFNQEISNNYDEKRIYDILKKSSFENLERITSNIAKDLDVFFDKKEINIHVTTIGIVNKSGFN